MVSQMNIVLILPGNELVKTLLLFKVLETSKFCSISSTLYIAMVLKINAVHKLPWNVLCILSKNKLKEQL